MRRKGVLALTVGLFAGFGLYGYNVHRNVSARTRVEAACTATERHAEAILEQTGPLLSSLSDDPEVLPQIVRGAVTRPCDAVRGELTWWRWGWGTTVTVDLDPRGELHEAAAEMAVRCPTVLRETLGASPLFDGHVEDVVERTCGQLTGQVAPEEQTMTLPLWSWADELEARERMLRNEAVE